MSSVNPPSDGGYNYYHKNLSELEDELKNEQKRAKKREADTTRSLEEKYQANLAERDRQNERTVDEIRKNASDTIKQDRLYQKAENDRIKRETYDKYGRYNGLESDTLNRQLDDLKASSQRQQQLDQERLRFNEDSYSERMEEAHRDFNERLEQNARANRDAANETYSKAYRGQVDEYQHFKDEAEKKYAELVRRTTEETQQERARARRAIQETEHAYDRKSARLRETNGERFDKLDNAYEQRLDKATADLAESRDRETSQLRGQITELQENQTRYMKEKGQGAQEAVDQFNDEWRSRERRTSEDYEKQIARLKQHAREADRYSSQLNNKNLQEKDSYFTRAIQQVNADNHREKKDLERTFNRGMEQQQTYFNRDREKMQASSEAQRAESEHRMNDALQNQAKAYQDTIERQRAADDEKIQLLQKELNVKKTSDDTSDISPAAEATVRKSVIGEYEKILSTERSRNDRNVDSMQKEYVRRVNDTLEEKESSETSIRKQNASDREIERARLLNHIQDTELMRDETLRNKDYETTKQVDNLNRNYASMLERQRREYDDMMLAQKNEASFRITALRQEGDFAVKMAQRAFTQRQNELIRDYDKKLTEQKAQHDAQTQEIKYQAQQTNREVERRAKLAMDEQSRAFEQRLAQAEATHKERERYIVENYQDQLEKVKRSNALLIQKKS